MVRAGECNEVGEVVERFAVLTVIVSQGNGLAQVQPGVRLEGSVLVYITITDAAVVSGYGSRERCLKLMILLGKRSEGSCVSRAHGLKLKRLAWFTQRGTMQIHEASPAFV